MRIAIHGRGFTEKTSGYVRQIFEYLSQKNIQVLLSDEFVVQNERKQLDLGGYEVFERTSGLEDVKLFLSLGGDGTLLETLTYVRYREIPIMGINMGRLGFLATISKNNIKTALDLFFDGQYEYDERTMLHLDSGGEIFENNNFALNEFAILKNDTSSMINVKCYIDGIFLNSYWADGLMVSTPTGSTGYSLSCGGPVVFPRSENFIITPISPHNLNVRPLIVSDKSIITFDIESQGRYFLTSLDSRSLAVDSTIKLSVRKEDFKAKLIALKGYNFLDTLRNKLNWGLDMRN